MGTSKPVMNRPPRWNNPWPLPCFGGGLREFNGRALETTSGRHPGYMRQVKVQTAYDPARSRRKPVRRG